MEQPRQAEEEMGCQRPSSHQPKFPFWCSWPRGGNAGCGSELHPAGWGSWDGWNTPPAAGLPTRAGGARDPPVTRWRTGTVLAVALGAAPLWKQHSAPLGTVVKQIQHPFNWSRNSPLAWEAGMLDVPLHRLPDVLGWKQMVQGRG